MSSIRNDPAGNQAQSSWPAPTPRPLSAEPLTEEERHVMFFDATHPRSGVSIVMVQEGGRVRPATDVELRLLATLDAARAAITPEAGEDWPFEDPAVRAYLSELQRRHREYEEVLVQRAERAEAALRVTPVEGEAGLRAAMDRALIAFYETHIALVYKSEKGRREYLTGQRARDGRESWRRQVEAAVRAALSPEEPRQEGRPHG